LAFVTLPDVELYGAVGAYGDIDERLEGVGVTFSAGVADVEFMGDFVVRLARRHIAIRVRVRREGCNHTIILAELPELSRTTDFIAFASTAVRK